MVATNNYRAGGGGDFPGLDGSNVIIEAPDSNRDVLAAYILDQQVIDPSADGNWSFVPLDGDPVVTFRSSVNGAASLGDDAPIELRGVDENGVGQYRLRFP